MSFIWALIVWLVQMAGAWALVGLSILMIFRRTSFSAFAVVRSLVTAAVVLTLAHQYGFATDGVMGWMNSVATKYSVMAAVAGVALVLLAAVYVSVGRPGARTSRFLRLFSVEHEGGIAPGPVSVMLVLLAAAGFLYWSMQAISGYGSEFVRFLCAVLLFVPAAVFLLLVPFSVAGTVFNAANAHPALPALAAPLVAVAAVVTDRFVGGVIATPDNLGDPLAIAGLVAVIGLSAADLVLLRRRGLGLTQDPPERVPGSGPRHAHGTATGAPAATATGSGHWE